MKNLAFSSVFAVVLLTSSQAYAGGEIFDTTSVCVTPDCSAMLVGATIANVGGATSKWVTEVYVNQGQCLRLSVTQQYADLQMVLVAPDGIVYRDDDGGGFLRPLVKIDPAPNSGWYTVSIGRFFGVPDTGNFTLAVGRYNAGNPNCFPPTPPVLATARMAIKGHNIVLKPRADEPGSR